jgi:hypothetical protein
VASESKDLVSNPLPLVAVALLAAGVLVRTLPLESARPHDASAQPVIAVGEQDVRARLWQDPFEVVPRPARRETSTERAARIQGDSLHAPASLTGQLRKAIEERGDKVTILGVMVFGSPYAEDVEARRRMRYAVLSGLAARHYVPDNPGALGYVWTDAGPAAKVDADAADAAAGRVRMPEVVPYEWFTAEGPQHDMKQIEHKQVKAELKAVPTPKEKLLLLWLDEDAFGAEALTGLSQLVQRIACAPAAAECGRAERFEPVRILGPAGSGTLKSIVQAAHDAGQPPAGQVRLQFTSAFATVPKDKLKPLPDEWQKKLAILRTIGSDDDLAKALVEELALRRVNPAAREGKAECRDGIVLVSEWDTHYGRSLPVVLRDQIAERCRHAAPVWWFSYLRGLDGTLPGARDEGARKRDDARKPADAEELLASGAARDRSEGRSQFDYLRRIGERIRQYDEEAKSQGRSGVRAIGVLGSDVYDKLLVLQALRPMFPDAIFFTTDMDARLTHADQNAWARNLIVASHYGLALHPGLQRDVPPFRDGYQTAAFLGTMMAVAREPKAPAQEHVNEWLAGSFARTAAESAAEGAFDYDAAARPRAFGGKKLYEIGRTRAVELDANGAFGRARCDRNHLAECRNVHPRRDRSTMGPDLAQPQAWLFAGGAALAFLLLFLTSRTVRENWRRIVAAIGLVAAAAAGLRWVIQLDVAGSGMPYLRELGFVIVAAGTACGIWLAHLVLEARVPRRTAIALVLVLGAVAAAAVGLLHARPGTGEPMEWFEGVSTWPTEYLRLAATILGLGLLVFGWTALRRQADAIQREFFVPLARRDAASPCAVRPAMEALRRIGRAFASGFPPAHDYFGRPEDCGTARVDAMRLWHRYRRRTAFWPSAGRVATGVALAFAAGALVLYLDPPSVPARGEVAHWTHLLLSLAAVSVLVVLIFSVVDATRMSTGLIRALSERPTDWPRRTLARAEARCGVPARLLEGWIDFEFIVAFTRGVARFIYCPFAVLLLLIVSRSTVFDAWDFPLPLLVLLAAAALYATFCALSLRRAAEEARRCIVASYEDECLRLEAAGAGADGADPQRLARGLRTLLDRIRNTREAAFLPLTQQPAVRALLIPFGGFGGLSLIEYLVFAQA